VEIGSRRRAALATIIMTRVNLNRRLHSIMGTPINVNNLKQAADVFSSPAFDENR
jgi:hypothetical protein